MSWGGSPLLYLSKVGSERQSDFLQVARLDTAGRCVLLRFVNSGPALGFGREVHPTHPGPLPVCLPSAVCLQGSLELGGHSPGPSLTCSLTPKGSSLPSPGRSSLLQCWAGMRLLFGLKLFAVMFLQMVLESTSNIVYVGRLACPHSIKFGQNTNRLAVPAPPPHTRARPLGLMTDSGSSLLLLLSSLLAPRLFGCWSLAAQFSS